MFPIFLGSENRKIDLLAEISPRKAHLKNTHVRLKDCQDNQASENWAIIR